jgi:hypothetical protein
VGQKTPVEQVVKTPKALLYSKVPKYVATVGVLLFSFIGSETFLIGSRTYLAVGALIFVFSLPAAIAVASYFAGVVCEIYNRELAGTFLKSFVAQSTFIFFIFDSSFSILLITRSTFAYSLSFFLLPLLFVSNALLLNRFADKIISGKKNQAVGLAAKRLAISLGVAFFASFLSFSFFTQVIAYPLYYSALAYGILSVSPIIAYSKQTENFQEAGLYLMRTSLQWAIVAFFVGVVAQVLAFFQNNIIAYAVIVTLVAFIIGAVGFRVYSLGATRIAAEAQEVYQKHVHQFMVVQDESFDFLRNNINEFVKTGRKENLLIALTTLLTNAGFSFERSQALLSRISSYEIPAIHKIPYLSMKKSLELEIEKRSILIKDTLNLIAQETSVTKTT